MKLIGLALVVLAVGVLPQLATAEKKNSQAAIVAGEITAFANQLAIKPNSAIDFTHVSGEYCRNLGLGSGGHMSHVAVDPSKTVEDVIDFVNAKPLMAAGANFDKLPRMPKTLGSMKSKQWYFLPAGQKEPHHGMTMSFPLLIRATDIK